MSQRGRSTLTLLGGIVGGLLLGAASTVDWFAVEAEREVGGVPVPGEEGIAGGLLAGELLPLGLAAAVVALISAVLRGTARQVAGGMLLLVAATAAWRTARPLLAGPPGAVAAGPVLAGLGVLLLIAAGLLALRPAPPPRLPDRYDLDADDELDDEWRLASAEDDDGHETEAGDETDDGDETHDEGR